jgi:hypothetical protein
MKIGNDVMIEAPFSLALHPAPCGVPLFGLWARRYARFPLGARKVDADLSQLCNDLAKK